MDESPQSQPLPPKRSSRLRLIVLLITLALMTAVYLPLRTSRANDKLYQGLMMGDTETVHDALANGADPDLALRPPEARIRPGSLLDFVRLLLHRSLRTPTNNARTALMSAAGSGNVEIVSELLRHNANVNLRLDNGYSALLYAASKQPPDIVAALLAKGADIHAHTREGATPLLLAAQIGQTQNVRLLLAKGEDIHEIDLRSQTALALAAENRHEETVQFLLSQGADERDLNVPGPSSMVPTMRFTTSGPNRSIITINGTTTIIQGGQPIRLTPQTLPNGTQQPLIFAAKCGSPSLLQFLWKRADPDTKRKVAWGVLCDTVQSGQIESVRFLLSQDLPVNPPRDTAARVWRNASVPTGYNPTQVYTPLHYAAAQQKPDIAAMLIAHGANVNAEDMFGTTPLLAASAGGHLATMRLLIAHGANVRAAERNSGQNALMRGVQNVEIARLLLDHGLDVNARDRNGRTALMQCYSLPVATLLIARGADVKVRDTQGNTALLTAIRSMKPDFVKLLLTHGADVNSVNSQGETPLSTARSMRFAPLISLLTSAGAKH
jgi:ankyrin repeat protein